LACGTLYRHSLQTGMHEDSAPGMENRQASGMKRGGIWQAWRTLAAGFRAAAGRRDPSSDGAVRAFATPPVAAAAAAALLMVAACAPGGQSARNPALLPAPAQTGAAAQTQGAGDADAPEGAPGAAARLARQQGLALLGDSALAPPPPNAVRVVDGVPVALLLPLSGRLSGPGQALMEGAQMALFDVANPEVRLLPFDTEGTVPGAERAARDAVQAGARLIVGPLLAQSVSAVRPIAEQARIPVIGFSNSSRVAGEGVYLAGFAPEEQVEAIVDHAVREGRRRFAVLAPSNDYGNVVVDALRAATEARGAAFARVEFYDPSAMDFAAQIQRLSDYGARVQALRQQRAELNAKGDEAARRALRRLEVLDTWGDPPFDALLLPVLDVQTLRILSAQLAFYDVDQPAVRILGLQRWAQFPDLAAEPALIGSRFPSARSPYRERFETRFRDVYGRDATALSVLAYDVTAVAAALAGDGRSPPRYGAETLADDQGFIGAQGLFRFREDGLAQRVFAILEVQGEGVAELEPAPSGFDRPVAQVLPEGQPGTGGVPVDGDAPAAGGTAPAS
jgi:ABC-type branched-subunit amino acid transport system substrate-binding protein